MPVVVRMINGKPRLVEDRTGRLARSGGTVIGPFRSRAAAERAARARNRATEGR